MCLLFVSKTRGYSWTKTRISTFVTLTALGTILNIY